MRRSSQSSDRWCSSALQNGHERGESNVQGGDVAVGGAGDHPPAAGVDGVDVPVVERVVGVLQLRLDGHQSHHCGSATGKAKVQLHQICDAKKQLKLDRHDE